jgi:glutathione S-transferase
MTADTDIYAPYKVYKADMSYFSGKLEAYLRYKEIPHIPIDADWSTLDKIAQITGTRKVPAVKTANGKWLFDTTPMLQWFEKSYPAPPVLPADQALQFVALLIEDYGDEWLWRPAMWWRWVPRASRWAVGWHIGSSVFSKLLARPAGWFFGKRQLREWLWNDGVTRENSDKVRDMLFREFEFLEPLLDEQPYLLGSHPSIADFGYFGSMFRHFGNDPDSSEIMRRQAPNTYEWLARLWNVKPYKLPKEQEWVWPRGQHWHALLKRLTTDYLPYLHQNAVAFRDRKERFDHVGNTFTFVDTKTTLYRVWCREVLQKRYKALALEDKDRVDELFSPYGGLGILEKDGVIASNIENRFSLPIDPDTREPYKVSPIVSLFGQPRN